MKLGPASGLEDHALNERYAALQQMLATVLSMRNTRERSAAAAELCDRAAALVEETKGAERGALMIQGIAARLANRWAVAERSFRRVTDLWPQELDGWLELTWALGTLERTGEALVAAQRAADLRPDSPAALGNLASALVQSGRAREALPVIHRALELDPSDWKNQQIRNHGEAAAAEPQLAPETEPAVPWYKRWFR
jgi:Flp pilus assembly protein TadD